MIPVNIAPRYGSPPPLTEFSSGLATEVSLSVSVSVKMTGNIKSITSPTHPIAVNLGTNAPESSDEHDTKLAYVSLGTSSPLETDIILVFAVQDLDRPRCTMEPDVNAGTNAYALTFVPRFNLPALPQQGIY